jgi:hypothetical protein
MGDVLLCVGSGVDADLALACSVFPVVADRTIVSLA